MGPVGAEDIRVQQDHGSQVLRRGRADGDSRGPAVGRPEETGDPLGVAHDREAELFVERLPRSRRVEAERDVPGLGDHMVHQLPRDSLPRIPLRDEHHADGCQPGAVRGHHAAGHQALAVGVIHAVASSGGEEQAPPVLIAWPATVFAEIGAGDQVARGEAPDMQFGDRTGQ